MEDFVQHIEEFIYVLVTNTGNGSNEPDYLAVVDVNPESDLYNSVVHKLEMHYVNDEVHHLSAQYSFLNGDLTQKTPANLIIPGLNSSRIYVIETKTDLLNPEISAVIEPEKLIKETRYSCPNTVLQVSPDILIVSMLGSENKESSGGFAVIDAKTYDVLGRWENEKDIETFNYDFSLNHDSTSIVSTDFCNPKTLKAPLNFKDVIDQKYGTKIHFWDFKTRQLVQSIDLGADGFLPLNIQWFHGSSDEGIITTALSGNIWHFFSRNDHWEAEKIAGRFEPFNSEQVDHFVPTLTTSHEISLDNQSLYVAEWLQGKILQFDISNIESPRVVGELKMSASDAITQNQQHSAGPSMIKVSNDSKRLYATSSFVNSWDNQFFPKQRSWVIRANLDTELGEIEFDNTFYLDFSPGRSREIYLP